MNDVERLRSVLARLKRGDDGAEGGAGDPDDMLAPVLQEIDETVLPRELRFQNDRGEHLALIVSARRVLRISEIRPESLAARFALLCDQPLSEDSKPQLDALRALLETFLEGTDELRVTTTRPAGAATASDIGLGTDILARLWSEAEAGTAQEPEPEPEPEQDLLSALCAAAAAHIVWTTGEIAERKGADGMVALLQRLSQTEAFVAPTGPSDGPACTVLPAPEGQGTTLAHLRDGETQALLLLPGVSAAEIARMWSRARRASA